MAYHPLKKFKGKELSDELDLALARHLNQFIRGELDSEGARDAYFSVLTARLKKRQALKYRMKFQHSLRMAVLAGVPEPSDEDLETVAVYLMGRVENGKLSLAEARERMRSATRFLPEEDRERWVGRLEASLLRG